jgi:hypothetical protein
MYKLACGSGFLLGLNCFVITEQTTKKVQKCIIKKQQFCNKV